MINSIKLVFGEKLGQMGGQLGGGYIIVAKWLLHNYTSPGLKLNGNRLIYQ
jgi:hypothetical protein